MDILDKYDNVNTLKYRFYWELADKTYILILDFELFWIYLYNVWSLS